MTNYKTPLFVVGAAVVIAAGAYVFFTRGDTPVQQQASNPQAVPEAVEPIEHPVPAPQVGADDAPLPSLANSDTAFLDHLGKIFNLKQYGEQLILESVITRFVVVVDNLDRRQLPLRHMLTQSPQGKFMVTRQDAEKLFLDERNFQRYEPFVAMLNAMDVNAFAALYAKYYPLFQQAYEENGYPKKYFNDRFVKVIDHLIATPKLPNGPIALTQAVMTYRYTDPNLEKLSSGQKVLIRIGGNNAESVKVKLIELRKVLTQFTRNAQK